MEKDDDGKDTNVEVSRNTPADPVLDVSKWTPYPGEEANAAVLNEEVKQSVSPKKS